VPWVCLQLTLVLILVFWPESVTYWISNPVRVDPNKQFELQIPDAPPPLFFGD
jgi:hypothetical protein